MATGHVSDYDLFFSTLLLWEFIHDKIYKFATKARLGGETIQGF